MSLHFTSHDLSDGIVDRGFVVGDVPGVLWSPESARPDAPLVLMGHGGGLHKRAPGLVARARRTVTTDGFHVAAVDAPGHGERPRPARDQEQVDAMLRDRDAGRSVVPVVA